MPKPRLNADLDHDLLPPKARELADHIGMAALLKLVESHGGLPLFIPRDLNRKVRRVINGQHYLIKLMGKKAAHILSQQYGGDAIEIPKCEVTIRAMLHDEIRERRKTESEATLAQEYGMWGRSIRRINAAGDDAEDPQEDLF